MARVAIYVTPKAGILDPQGVTIERALPALGFEGVSAVRVGRYITLEIEGAEGDELNAQVESMSRRLLANPIIEDFFVEIVGDQEYPHDSCGGSEEVIVGEENKPRKAGEHAASPWTAADPYASGQEETEADAEGNEDFEKGKEGVITSEDKPPRKAGEHAASPWTAADPFASGKEEVAKEDREAGKE